MTHLPKKFLEYEDRHLEHPAGRTAMTAAYLLAYWADKGAIPRYDGVIDGLRATFAELSAEGVPVVTPGA